MTGLSCVQRGGRAACGAPHANAPVVPHSEGGSVRLVMPAIDALVTLSLPRRTWNLAVAVVAGFVVAWMVFVADQTLFSDTI